ncbi:MAG: pilus assembly protein [Gemmataceae bacterium]|nr:pilus assembly protein [Gemmataceae bacterium]
MIVKPNSTDHGDVLHRRGAAAVEFAVCAPLIFLLLLGLWEVGRMTEVSNVMWNAAREGGRDASLGEQTFATVAGNVLTYLQSAEPRAFGKGHTITMKEPVVALPDKTSGVTCWDATANRELCTITFLDCTSPDIIDPRFMKQLDRFEIGIQVPYGSIGWLPTPHVTGTDRLHAKVNWVSMVDSPFQIAPYLPAQ